MPIRKDSEHRFCVALETHKTGGKLPKGANECQWHSNYEPTEPTGETLPPL